MSKKCCEDLKLKCVANEENGQNMCVTSENNDDMYYSKISRLARPVDKCCVSKGMHDIITGTMFMTLDVAWTSR